MKKVNPIVLIALVLLVVALLLPMGTTEGYRGFGARFRKMREDRRRRRQKRDMERRRRQADRARQARFRAMQRSRRGQGGPPGRPRGAPVN